MPALDLAERPRDVVLLEAPVPPQLAHLLPGGLSDLGQVRAGVVAVSGILEKKYNNYIYLVY